MSNIAFEFVEFPTQHVVVHVVTITHNTCAPKQLMSRNRNRRKHNYMRKQSRFLEMPQRFDGGGKRNPHVPTDDRNRTNLSAWGCA
jgi:hypothetical protein